MVLHEQYMHLLLKVAYNHCCLSVLALMTTAKDGGAIKAVLLPALRKLNEELTKMVEDGRESLPGIRSNVNCLEDFLKVEWDVGLFALQPFFIYVDCLKAVGVKTRAELEEMWRGCYHDKEVRDSVEELLSLEESLQAFYDNVDVEIQKAEDQLAIQNVTKVDDQLPTNLAITNCCSGEVVSLENVWKQSKFTHFVFLKFYF